MPKRSETRYQGKYYRKRVKKPDGSGYVDVYGKTQEERDQKVEELKKELSAAYEAEQKEKTCVYFYRYAAGWYARKSPTMSKSWQADNRRYINNVICPLIGQKEMREITSDDLAEIMATVAGKSRSYQKSLVSTIKQIFDAAEEADVIQKNPARKLKAGGRKPAKKDALTKEQEAVLLQTVRGLPVELFVMLALYTGMRREEILGLNWNRVHLDGDAPHIDVRQVCIFEDNSQPTIKSLPKTDAGWRTIPIPAQLHDRLQQEWDRLTADQKKRKLPVIHRADGSPLSYSAFRSQWNAITVRSTESGRALGEKVRNRKIVITVDFPVTPHLLRHTYITRLVMNRVPLKRVQYLAGHSDPAITLQIYTALMEHTPEDLIDDVRSTFEPPESTPERTPKGSE